MAFSVAMQGRGEFSFLIADLALSEGVIDRGWHGGAIWAIFLASMGAPLVFRWLLGREKKEVVGDGARAIGWSDAGTKAGQMMVGIETVVL